MDPKRRRAPATWVVSIAATSLFALAAGSAHAQSAEAERRFNEAEALLSAGKVAAACEAFEESNRLEPGAGVLIRIGQCKEKLGKLASALAAYRGALERVKDPRKKAIAAERVAALEPRISSLTISVAPEARVEGLVVSRDGARLEAADLGRPVPIDGGSYEIAARAPGHRRWSTSVEVAPEGDRAAVKVPALVEDRREREAAPAPGPAGEPEAGAPPEAKRSSRTGLKIAGYGLTGVAVASAVYVLYATVSGPIPDYESFKRPVDESGMEVATTSADCGDAVLRDPTRGEGNAAFDRACEANRRRLIAGVVALTAGLAGGVTLYLAYRGEDSPAAKQAAAGRRGRRGLAVTPLIGPGTGGAVLRLAW